MVWLPCPYLGRNVELTPERERHIRRFHPDLLPDHGSELATTLADPDQVRVRHTAPGELIFVREFDELGGKPHIVVVVVTTPTRDRESNLRAWIVTGYRAAEPDNLGDAIWEKA